ncbi:hypothetical protein ABH989_006554 [Bradyrhizobium ottawaense]
MLEIPSALQHADVQFLIPFPELPVAFLDLVEQAVEMNRDAADLVTQHRHLGAGGEVPALHLADRRRDALQRHEDGGRPAQEDRYGRGGDRDERCDDDHQRLVFGFAERLLQKADIEHADPLAITVDQRLVSGDVPVIDHESTVEPGVPVAQHGRAHRRRHARAERAPSLEQTDIGRYPHVVQEQRRGALAALRKARSAVDEIVDRVDEFEILVEQRAADQRSGASVRQHRPARRVHDHAARLRAAVGRHRIRGRHEIQSRALGQGRRNCGQLVIAENIDAGRRDLTRQRRHDDRPVASRLMLQRGR